jgi:hypothetical protein
MGCLEYLVRRTAGGVEGGFHVAFGRTKTGITGLAEKRSDGAARLLLRSSGFWRDD